MESRPTRVLLVEDDEEDYLLTGRLLKATGQTTFEITWARNFETGLSAVRSPYDVCLVDYRLGAESGLTFIKEAIAVGFAGPMILLTGRGDHDVDVLAMRSGAADYLVKDQITPQLLERVIRHAIERKVAELALRRSEEQLRQSQKMEAIGGLAAGIAHDFNNLLSVILGYSELVANELKVGDSLRSDVEEIRGAGRRAAELTRQLLAFSRQQVLQPRVVDMNEICAGMEKMLARVIGEDVELRSIAGNALDKIMVDPSQMEQVLVNLAVNSRDAMPGGGQLTIETANMMVTEKDAALHIGLKAGPHVMLSVTDTGTGMDKETQTRMFEPFFTTKEIGKGTGLGLATVFGIVRQSGGAIWAQSEIGKGTKFVTYFPSTDSAPTRPARPSQPPGERRSLRGSETILVVEDEDSVRNVVATILRRYGYEILEAQSAGDALIVAEQHKGSIDLLLADVVLPRVSGPELAGRMALVRPEMKVVYMSGYAGGANFNEVQATGKVLIQKPVTAAALVRQIREVLVGA